ncbi:MAG: alkaline phosphatase family protein, partial [Chloroflexi bacterium]|nr:alkaline phosphatase family protein [Chloroflexota bacterium]
MQRLLLTLALAALVLAGCAAPVPPTLTATSAPVSTAAPTATPTITATATLTSTPTATPTPLPPSKVVVISIDGLRPDGLLQANAPNIFALAKRGAYTWKAQTIFPPVTLPSHASMLTGYTPEGHGLTWNDNLPDRGAIAVPTILSIAREAGLRTVMITGKEKFRQLNAPGSTD